MDLRGVAAWMFLVEPLKGNDHVGGAGAAPLLVKLVAGGPDVALVARGEHPVHQLDEAMHGWDDCTVSPAGIDFDQLDKSEEKRIPAPEIASGDVLLAIGADPAVVMLMCDDVVGSCENLGFQALIIEGISEGY